MILNYLKTALRVLKRYKFYSIISITGLTVAISASALILLFLLNEFSFDRFHEKADRIYRVSTVEHNQGEKSHGADSPPPLANVIREQYPGVEEAVRIRTFENQPVNFEDRSSLKNGMYVEPSFFRIFSFELLQGDKKYVFSNPQSVVLTKSLSEFLFGEGSPIGETVKIDDKPFRVTGVIQDVPYNSHLQFDYVLSWKSYEERIGDNRETFLESWYYGSSHTYVLMRPNAAPMQLENNLTDVVNSKIKKKGYKLEFSLQPLRDIYLYSNLDFEIGPTGSVKLLWILGSLVLLIVIIASINFINLATAYAKHRFKEIGVRKTLGAQPSDLKKQFMGETVLICLFSLLFAVPLIELTVPFFSEMVGKSFTLSYLSVEFAAGYILLALVIGLLAGFYPSVHIAKKGIFQVRNYNTRGGFFRKVLVTAQFAIAALLLMGTIGIYSQFQYMVNKDPGFDPGDVVVIRNRNPVEFSKNYDVFKQAVTKYAGINTVSASTSMGPIGGNQGKLMTEGNEISVVWTGIDPEFLPLFAIPILKGRNFSDEYSTDSRNSFIVNETAVRELGLTEPVGAKVRMAPLRRSGTIIGVVKDFHFNSLHDHIKPLVMIRMSESAASYLSIKMESQRYQESVENLTEAWNRFAPNYPLEYSFLNDRIENLYSRESQYIAITTLASALAITLTCMGLLGLVVFMIANRTKEIGIRKVLGATVSRITILLAKDFIILAFVGILLAVPVVFIGLNQWLQQFAYRVTPGLGDFLWSAAIIMGITLLTVSWKTVKAAMVKPVKTIRND